ncbi:5-guanidino-2-oxopentanoate decarboxylase [Sulfitobacter sp. D35]|uniref:5-guanidino-2-oxopentanoate decarboxylase n=1 Tax=Sulfitobacter sp. D35 TaxID=3083252 RepID=UPI00296E7F39|nr:5-guanidino-2-oxopentanoate decarboxylase [Sulfitobacter sp. D35]MDW4499868.1 5-guanidino-2-oxopentanoate decarboxylase [Sulfitobacter sp. D35]
MTNRPLGAQISHMLKARGVDVIFGIPGVHNQEMYRGIEEAGIRHVLARHEQGAGFMADGYARASGQPGVVYVITGPGLCNIMTPMGQAYSDSVPMLVISSCLDETSARRGQLHQMKDQRAAAETVCDWSEEARSAEAAYGLIDRALAEFETSRPRPKHLQVPIALLEAPADDAPARPELADLPSIPPSAVEVVAERLLAANRPLFVFGGGAAQGDAAAASVLRKAGSGSFTSYAGRGIVPKDDPLHFGAALARPTSAEVFAKADLVICVGTDLAEVDLWRDALGQDCAAVIVNRDPEVLAAAAPGDLGIAADAAAWLAALDARLDTRSEASKWTAQEVADWRARWRAEVEAERPGILPVADALRACLPQDTMIFSDMTQFAYSAKEVWPMDRPGHWHHPFGFGTLGYATPAAIGGAVARPGLPSMAIIGDYGFHYTMQELGVAVELGLPLPIVLWDNGKLGEIEASMVSAQIAPNAVVARNPDFCKLAEAFGARAARPESLNAMQDAVRAAFDADGPTLIHLNAELLG